MTHTNATATRINDNDYSCPIANSCKTCLTNHMGSISYHITPLVINSLGGRHTHTHTHTRTHTHTHNKKPGAFLAGLKSNPLPILNTYMPIVTAIMPQFIYNFTIFNDYNDQHS